MSTSLNVVFRKASIADMASVYQLVKELAIYEKAEEEVTSTVEDYKASFEEGIFEVIVAELEGEVVGMVLYYMAYSTWKGKMMYLDDFVVKEKYRGHGIGQKLFDVFIAECRKQEAVLVKWQVLDWNKPAIRFYERNKAIIEKDWWNGKLFL